MKMKMKTFANVIIFGVAGLADAVAMGTSAGVHFGPKNCVHLTRSSAGSCTFTTECDGIDTSTTEFAFDCIVKGEDDIKRHSFGMGGFDDEEEYDTGVKCDRCANPSPLQPVKHQKQRSLVKARVHHEAPAVPVKPRAKVGLVAKRHVSKKQISGASANTVAKSQTQFWPFSSPVQPAKDVAKFGPNGCVSTYKNEESHCIVQTDCQKSDLSEYEFGIICVDKTGTPVRHLFGKRSFEAEETFDTLIKCDQCLGLEDIPDSVAMNGEVVTLAGDVSNLKAMMKNISINVEMLNEEVFRAGPAPAPASAPAVAAAPAAKVLLNSHRKLDRVEGYMSNLRRKRHARRREEDDDDYDDDDDDDADDDRYDDA